jgi:hypothetical protein
MATGNDIGPMYRDVYGVYWPIAQDDGYTSDKTGQTGQQYHTGPCEHCGRYHTDVCPRVKSIESLW